MSTTNNKNLSEPNYGDTNWNVPLNNNFTYIDQGLGSTFPVYVGTGGTTTLSTGTATISGVTWYNAQQLTVVSGSAGSPQSLASDATISIANNISGTANTLGGSWIIRNTLTTAQQGIYKVYVKVTGSATSIEVANGTSLYVYTDGTTIRLVDDGVLQSVTPARFSTLKSNSTTNLNISSGVTTVGWQLPFTVTITNASPAVVNFSTAVSPDATLPANNTPVYFTTTGTLPSGITANTTYYVRNALSTSFNLSPYYGGTLAANTVTISTASPAVITNAADNAPQAGTSVVFTTTGALPTGLTAGATYYVANPSGKTYNVSASSGLTPLVNTTAGGYGIHTATFGTTLINTTTAGSGTHTINMGTTAPLNVEGAVSFTGTLQAAGNPGASGQFLKSQGSATPPIWATIGQTVIDYQPFTATGTWVKPAGASGDDIVIGYLWGGGGGGGRGGGGGGACLQFMIKSSDLGGTETVTIGAGGAASTAGGTTIFATNYIAYGGGAGGNTTLNGTNAPAAGRGGGGGGLGSAGSGGNAWGYGGSAAGGDISGLNYVAVGASFSGGSNEQSVSTAATTLAEQCSVYGGGAGGNWGNTSNNTTGRPGGNSIWGGGGGGSFSNNGTNGGNSVFGGAGGNEATAGSAPGGGGGGEVNAAGSAGGRGEARIWTIRAVAG